MPSDRARSLLSRAVYAVPNAVSTVWGWLGLLVVQFYGFVRNMGAFVRDRSFFESRFWGWAQRVVFVPAAYYLKMLRWSVTGTPREQIVGSIVAAVALVVASFGILTVVALIFVIPLLVGVARMVPLLNSRYNRYVTDNASGAFENRGTRWVRRKGR